jgi:glycosyltransferase involved in cell wall biosynthesis
MSKNEIKQGLGKCNCVLIRTPMAKGMLFTGCAEAFGMALVEAMASGKPVVAPKEGGLIETVVNNETGVLIDSLSPEALAQAIRSIGVDPGRYRKACQERAALFDAMQFERNMKMIIDQMRG